MNETEENEAVLDEKNLNNPDLSDSSSATAENSPETEEVTEEPQNSNNSDDTNSAADSGDDSSNGSGDDSGNGSGEDSGSGSGEDSGSGSGDDSGNGSGDDSSNGSGDDSGSGSGEDSSNGSGEDDSSGSSTPPPTPIEYGSLVVDTLTFLRILEFSVEQELNQHGKATVIGTLDSASAKDEVGRVDETTVFKVTTTAENQHDTLFVGCVEDISLEMGATFSKVTVNLISLSCKMDLTKESRSFQDSTEEYQDLLDTTIENIGTGTVTLEVDDQAIDALIIQYDETAWEFSKRMGSHLSAPLVPTLNVDVPTYSVGIPPSSKTAVVTTLHTKYEFNSLDFARYTENATSATLIAADFSREWVESDAYLFVGDTVTLNEEDKRVLGVRGHLVDGLLKMEYALGDSDSVDVPRIECENLVGKMLLGTVKKVEKDTVQVHYHEIDQSYNSSDDGFLPFSTAYSSSDGSGWYCMPEVEDMVRICFPSNVESDAFVASSVCLIAPTTTRNKSWKAPGGKEILLTDEGIYIIANEGKLFINLTDSDGIQLYSSEKITISSDGSVELKSAKTLKLIAEKEILVGTDKAYLNLKSGSATIVANKVEIN